MFAMVVMCLSMLCQFQIFFLTKIALFGSWLEREVSGGVCCHGAGCHNDEPDRRLWDRFTANSSTPFFDTVRSTA